MGLMGDLFGSDPEYDYMSTPAERQRLRWARRLFREARGRVPGASADERMMLGEANAMIGQQGAQMMEGLFAESAGGYGDTSSSSGDMLGRLSNMLLSTKAQATSQLMASFIRNKRADMMGAVGIAPSNTGQFMQTGGGPGVFGDLVGAAANAYGLSQGMRGAGAPRSPGQLGDRSDMTPLPASQNSSGDGTMVAAAAPDDPMTRMASGGQSPYGDAYSAAYAMNPKKTQAARAWWLNGGGQGQV